MASSTSSLHHRAISNIRIGSGAPGSPSQTTAPVPGSPHTPLRTTSSAFASPSSLRAEEDTIIIEFGSRHLLVGFAGDAVPKGVVRFGPEEKRRVGDFRRWQVGYKDDWKRRARGWEEGGSRDGWDADYELWRGDVRGLDMGLMGDKIERGLREAFAKYLLIDSRPRRMAIVLPPALPTPLLSTTLDTLFGRFESPYISLHSTPVACAVAAGLRSGLIVDLGWAETRVTSIYEYREVYTSRSVRGGKLLVRRLHALLARILAGKQDASAASPTEQEEDQADRVVSFEECEEVARRMVWCKASIHAEASQSSTKTDEPRPPADGLPTVTETDETSELAASTSGAAAPMPPQTAPESDITPITIPLTSTTPPTTIQVPFNQLSGPTESTYFSPQITPASWDDHEQPLHLLLFHHLLRLLLDVRGACTPRIIFTGGSAGIPGLRARCLDEVSHLVRERGGWSGVTGKAVTKLRENIKFARRPAPTQSTSDTSKPNNIPASGAEQDGVWHDAANALPEPDPVEAQIQRNREKTNGSTGPDPRLPPVGELRAVDSLGAWSGASLLTHLKIPAIATVDRELWAQQGAAGASRVGDVDLKAQQRQSMGPGGGLMRGQGGGNWTLGAWGAV